MMNRSLIRTLITVLLVTAIGVAFGSEAFAATQSKRMTRPASTLVGGNMSKPGVGPMAGEPDSPNGGPLPPKDGAYPTGRGTSELLMRLRLLGGIWKDIALSRLRF